PRRPTLFPYTTLFRSAVSTSTRTAIAKGCGARWPRRCGAWSRRRGRGCESARSRGSPHVVDPIAAVGKGQWEVLLEPAPIGVVRSEEHTSELQSRGHL